MSSTFEAELPLKKIHPHPGNLRRAAIADDDMVASIREHGLYEPVIVAPHPDLPGEYQLIAGHRRHDGSTKAKRTTVPAIVRSDLITEGQQVEAMIIENGHRENLTPIEEAEGYAQLELLGYKPTQIAAAVGRPIKTIRARLGLLKLSTSTKERVHEGQLTLADALAIGEFADDAAATKELEKAAASGNLRYELQRAQNRRDRIRDTERKVADLVKLGVKPYKVPEDKPVWQLVQDGTVGRVWDDEWPEHKGCLAYIPSEVEGNAPTVVCTKPSKHASTEDKEAAAERERIAAERDAAEQARQEKADAHRAAASARTTTLLDLVGTGTKIAPAFRDLIRALLPYLLMHPECEDALKAYQDALEIPDADRWSSYWWGANADDNKALALQHFTSVLPSMSDGRIVRGLVGALVGMAETYMSTWDSEDRIDLQLVGSYYDLLGEAGYTNAPPDIETQDALREAWAALEDDPEEQAS